MASELVAHSEPFLDNRARRVFT